MSTSCGGQRWRDFTRVVQRVRTVDTQASEARCRRLHAGTINPDISSENGIHFTRTNVASIHEISRSWRSPPSPDHALCRAVKTCKQTKQDRAMAEGQPDKTRWDTLSGVYEHSKVARLRCWLWMRLLLRCSGRRIEIRSRKENVVSLWINLQRFCAIFRLNGFNLAEPVR